MPKYEIVSMTSPRVGGVCTPSSGSTPVRPIGNAEPCMQATAQELSIYESRWSKLGRRFLVIRSCFDHVKLNRPPRDPQVERLAVKRHRELVEPSFTQRC
jgi:hypothetical protein